MHYSLVWLLRCAQSVTAVQLYRLRGRLLGMLENRVYERDTTDCYQPLHHKCVLLCVCVNLPPLPRTEALTIDPPSRLPPIFPPPVKVRSQARWEVPVEGLIFHLRYSSYSSNQSQSQSMKSSAPPTLPPTTTPSPPSTLYLLVNSVCTRVSLGLYVCVCMCVCSDPCMSQCTEVVTGTGLLPQNLAAPVAAHFSVAPPVPVSVSAV